VCAQHEQGLDSISAPKKKRKKQRKHREQLKKTMVKYIEVDPVDEILCCQFE
jgi:hypothetical protein